MTTKVYDFSPHELTLDDAHDVVVGSDGSVLFTIEVDVDSDYWPRSTRTIYPTITIPPEDWQAIVAHVARGYVERAA